MSHRTWVYTEHIVIIQNNKVYFVVHVRIKNESVYCLTPRSCTERSVILIIIIRFYVLIDNNNYFCREWVSVCYCTEQH